MNNIDLIKKVGQLLVIGFEGKKVPSEIKDLIHKYHIGGIILFGRNIGTPDEILALTTGLQREAREAGYTHPLFICIDQENGVVRRLDEGASIFPGAMALGATDNTDHAYQIGLATGKELKSMGINWNLAPVLDVNNNPDNPVIGVRSFGESADKVALFGSAAMKGMQDAGIATTLKHFPGHGDTDVDSHLDLPVISHNMERLEDIELKPFKACIDANADTVMSAHVYFPEIEPEAGIPATLSKNVLTGLLREKLGFNGVITTDCMEMNAILNGVGTEKGGVATIKAGADLVMVSHTLEKQVGTIKEIIRVVENGEIEEARIDQSNARVQALKEKYLNWNDIPLGKQVEVPEIVGSNENKQLAYKVYKDSVTIVKNKGLLPLGDDARILVMHPDNGTTMQVEDKRYANLALGEAIREYQPLAHVHQFSNSLTEPEVDSLIEKASNYDTIIIGTLTISSGSQQITLIEKMMEQGMSVVVVAMRSPYDLAYLPEVPAYINTYEFTYPALKVAAGAIFGREEVKGKSPISIKQK